MEGNLLSNEAGAHDRAPGPRSLSADSSSEDGGESFELELETRERLMEKAK